MFLEHSVDFLPREHRLKFSGISRDPQTMPVPVVLEKVLSGDREKCIVKARELRRPG
jgi:hypothetical protein